MKTPRIRLIRLSQRLRIPWPALGLSPISFGKESSRTPFKAKPLALDDVFLPLQDH